MGALIGLLFAAGVLLVLSAGQPPLRVPRPGPTQDLKQLATAAGAGAAAFLAGLLVTGLLLVAGMCLVLGFAVPRLAQQRAARRRFDERRSAWPDVIDSMAGAIRAGMSLAEAVSGVGRSGPACLRAEFEAFAAEYRMSGNVRRSLLLLRDDLADPIADRVVEALLTAVEVGGQDLGRVLRTLSEFVRQELRLRGEAETRRGWTVNGARLAAAAPWLVLAFLSSRPGTLEAYRTSLGSIVLLGSAMVTVVAYLAMIKIGRLPEESRVLVPHGGGWSRA